jgi:hypothetical protein
MIEKKYTLVIGASENPERYAYKAIKALRANNRLVRAYGLKKGKVDDVVFETEHLKMNDIDTVTLYVGPKNQPGLYKYIVNEIKPRRIIFNPGTENPELYALAKAEGIICEEACTLVLLATNQYD